MTITWDTKKYTGRQEGRGYAPFCVDWEVFLPEELPKHAPTNACFGRFTKTYSTLGGPVWQWADIEGRDLSMSNSVPPNIYSESTLKGREVAPDKVLILDSLELACLKFLLKCKQSNIKGFRPVLITGWDWLNLNDNYIPKHLRKYVFRKFQSEIQSLKKELFRRYTLSTYLEEYAREVCFEKGIEPEKNYLGD